MTLSPVNQMTLSPGASGGGGGAEWHLLLFLACFPKSPPLEAGGEGTGTGRGGSSGQALARPVVGKGLAFAL